MITSTTFRADFPEFASTTTYPETMINFWIAMANIMLPTRTWGEGSVAATSPPTTMLDIAAELFVAHNAALEAQAVKAAAGGGVPGGGASGAVSSESVGSVSRSYDTTAGLIQDAGPWNLTTYGTRFYWMMMNVGRGPIQIEGCGGFGLAWTGPPVPPYGPNGF